ncbi:MAG: zinc-binding dehydrogenase [Candidatus Jordarchaeum sp.]|uniref:zinc-binding dehydrogenase n=1 Tax=Candidatus Jordarchaeum sp. TaxID=2823881 RepID=UPI00404B17D7
MKSALLYGKGDLRVVEIDIPEIGPNDALVKVKVCAVCPTDVRKYRTGNQSVHSYPVNLGHEWTGDVVKIGDNVENWKVGMRIAGAGFEGYAEYAKLDKGYLNSGMVLELPDKVSYEEGTFVEPLADCLHAVKDRAKVKAGDTVAIIGAGQMGLQLMMIAKSVGAKVIVSEVAEERLEYAEKFGADHVVNASKENPIEAIKKLTKDWGTDSVIVSIGNPTAIEQGLNIVRKGGRVVIFGGAPQGSIVQLDPNIIHYREVELTGSNWIGTIEINLQLYQEALDLIASKKVPVAEFITHRFTLDEIHKAFQVQENKEGLKVMIIPP